MSNQSRKQRTVVHVVRLFCLLISLLFAASSGLAQSTAFTYQGRLTDGGTPANGNYDLQFQLFDSSSGTTQIGPTQTLNVVPVSAGIFTVTLDFGANGFPGADRFLDISARLTGAGAFTPLTPRQLITATPYAVRSLNTASADGLSSACDGCVSDTNIGSLAASKLTGTIPVSAVPSGSGSYVQNSSSQQASSNFNITGDGKAAGTLSGNIISATTQFNIGSSRVLSSSGQNLFAGNGAGVANTLGANNSFFGFNAGNLNQTGSANSFFGNLAGAQSTSHHNSFFGDNAGRQNTIGGDNSFFGSQAGAANTGGASNSFFGSQAGYAATGGGNASFGVFSGANTTGNGNSFFGFLTGDSNTGGSNNAFFGGNAGNTNLTGSSNTLMGGSADVGSSTLINATAVGSRALVTQSSSLVLGSINGVNGATADTNVGIGTTAPAARLDVVGNINTSTQYNIGGNRVLSSAGSDLFVGFNAGSPNQLGGYNSFFGSSAGPQTTGGLNSFFGATAGENNTAGHDNSFFGYRAGNHNTNGAQNSFFGNLAGSLGTGSANAFFGFSTGSQTAGMFNSFFGTNTGNANTGGFNNTFFGGNAGNTNLTGDNNTVIGYLANVGSGDLANATAVGSRALVSQSNSLVLGSIDGVNFAGADTNVGIGTTAPGQALTIQRSGAAFIDVKANGGTQELFVGADSNGGIVSTISNHDLVLRAGGNSDKVRIRANGNVGIGTAVPNAKLQVAGGNVYIGSPNSLIITSPNGACWFITVNNAGALSANSVTCP